MEGGIESEETFHETEQDFVPVFSLGIVSTY
jgi:hypothetical protein